ncbi:MAG: GAF domain-containing protein [Dehalococcoidia bacterium]|nr:GAF domain-containing protein [Dehalococcoidia bacterium]
MAEAPTDRESIQQLQKEVEELRATNLRLHEQTDQRLLFKLAELAALRKVNHATNSGMQLGATLSLIVETVADVIRADICSIFLYEDEERLVLRATSGLNPDAVGQVSVRLGEGITGIVAKEGRPIALRDAWSDPRFYYVAGLREEPYRSIVSVPIILFSADKLVGVLNIQTLKPTDFNAGEVSFLETVAGQVAIAIENAKLYDQTDQKLQQKVIELSTLQRVSRMIASTLDLQKVLNLIVAQAVALSTTDMAAILQLGEDCHEATMVAAHGLDHDQLAGWRSRMKTATVGDSIFMERSVAVADILTDPRAGAISSLAEVEGFRSVFSVPLNAKGKTLGALLVFTRLRHEFTIDEVQLLSSFADEAAIALDNARLYDEAQRNLSVKSALLAEMHHRVKNNLQTVAALLSLQARHSKSSEIANPLRESVGRVQSIASVHDLLSQRRIGLVSVSDLAMTIIETASLSSVQPGIRVKSRITGGDVTLRSREATVLALVLNEILSNAISHGFTGRDEGNIHIAASVEGNQITIATTDDGRGLPEGFDLRQQAGLGLQIVDTLVVNELQGRFTLAADGGTVATIVFEQSYSSQGESGSS